MAPLIDPSSCGWDSARFLIFSDNVFANYIYYSHIFPAASALVLGFFIWFKSPRSAVNIALFSIAIFFSIWSFFDLILWATDKTQYTMFFWSIQIYFDLLLYVGALYFIYLFIDKRDVSLTTKIIMIVPFIPLFFFAHTNYNLIGFDFSNCDREALEGLLWQYVYLVEIGIVTWITILGARRFRRAQNKDTRKEILLVTAGILIFLLSFSWANITGSFAIDWDLSQYGLFGMPVFLAFLSYLIVRYREFGVKVLAAQILVAILTLLILAILLIRDIEDVRIIATITALLTVMLGYILVKSVKREVEQRELIEVQEKELERVNKQQENLLHVISHEIKGYLTKSEAGFSAITEGDYGAVPERLSAMATSALADVRKGVDMVMQILDSSNLKKGTVTFKKATFDFQVAVMNVIQELTPAAQEKNLTIDTGIAWEGNFMIDGDENKLRQHVIRNLIDNAIRYTPSGSIRVELVRKDGKIRFTVADNGVGITPEDMAHLFTEGGHGKDSIKVNVDSTGYGLFVAKQVTEAHGGTIHAESAGAGKGSEFVVELPT